MNPTELSAYQQAALAIILQKLQGNVASVQRERLLAGLRICPLTIAQCRHFLGMASRSWLVFGMRKMGYQIETVWTSRLSDCGRVQRIAHYTLTCESGPNVKEELLALLQRGPVSDGDLENLCIGHYNIVRILRSLEADGYLVAVADHNLEHWLVLREAGNE